MNAGTCRRIWEIWHIIVSKKKFKTTHPPFHPNCCFLGIIFIFLFPMKMFFCQWEEYLMKRNWFNLVSYIHFLSRKNIFQWRHTSKSAVCKDIYMNRPEGIGSSFISKNLSFVLWFTLLLSLQCEYFKHKIPLNFTSYGTNYRAYIYTCL